MSTAVQKSVRGKTDINGSMFTLMMVPRKGPKRLFKTNALSNVTNGWVLMSYY